MPDAAARQENIRGAFAVPRDLAASGVIAGKKILLIDDVSTTGATFHEAARPLFAAGAGSVAALCVAKT